MILKIFKNWKFERRFQLKEIHTWILLNVFQIYKILFKLKLD